MAVELATAYVSIIPSTQGIAKQLQKDVGGPLSNIADKSGRTAGQGFASNLAANAATTLDKTGGRIVGALSNALKGGAVAIGAGIATSIGLGLNRLVGIDEAEGKLRGLGHTAEGIATVMESALGSVRGTAFGLAEAATTAAGAVAAGIEPGEELTEYLSLTADAATIAGSSMGEMGSIVNKVTTSGRAMTDNLNQLADRGIPIFTWLQDEYGVTAAELSDMVSDGAVDAATFRKVIQDNIGGAALESGNTVSGAFANMGAAAGRFGAALIGPVFDQAGGFFGGVTGWIDGLTDRIGPFADQLADRLAGGMERAGEAFTVISAGVSAMASSFKTGETSSSGFIGVMETIGALAGDAADFFNRYRDTIADVVKAAGPAAGIVAGLATSVSLVAGAFRILIAATPLGIITALTTALVYAWQNSETFRNIVTGAFEAVQGAIERVRAVFAGGGGGMAAAFATVGEAAGRLAEWFRGVLGSAITYLQSVWDRIQPRIAAIGESFSGIWQTLQPVVQWLGERLPGAFSALWSVAGPILGFLVRIIGDTLLMAIEGVVGVFQGAVSAIEGILNVFAGLFTGDWSRMWEGVKQIASGIFDIIVGAVRTFLAVSVFKVVGGAFKAITGLFRNSWQSIRGIFQRSADDILGLVRGWVDTIRLRFMMTMDTIRALIRGAWTAIRALFRNGLTAVRTNVTNGLRNIVTTFRELPQRILKALGDLGRLLMNVGKDIVRGLVGGIKGMAGEAGKAVTGVVSGAVNSAKEALGISSPSKVFMEMGHQIGDGLTGGMGDRESAARRAGSSLVGATVPTQTVFATSTVRTAATMASTSAAALRSVAASSSRHVTLQVGERQFDAYLHESTRKSAVRHAVRTAA